MKKYLEPELEITMFDNIDIVMESGTSDPVKEEEPGAGDFQGTQQVLKTLESEGLKDENTDVETPQQVTTSGAEAQNPLADTSPDENTPPEQSSEPSAAEDTPADPAPAVETPAVDPAPAVEAEPVEQPIETVPETVPEAHVEMADPVPMEDIPE